MAKKKSNKNGAGSKADKVKPQDVMLMPPTNDVINLARRRKSAKKQQAELSGTIGEAIAQAVEKKHLDRKAFGLACQLDSLSDEKLAISYYHLLRYIDDLGIPERASAQGNMFEEDAGKADETDDGKPRVVAGRDTEEAAGKANAG
jgi:hypothetical protein